MRIPPLAEILDLLEHRDDTVLPSLRISVLRNITVEGVEPYLRYLAHRAGFSAHVRFGTYDAILQDATGAGPAGFLDATTSLVLVYFWLPAFAPALSQNRAGHKDGEVAEEIARVKAYSAACLRGIRSRTSAPILWHGIEMPAYPSLGIFDDQASDGQAAIAQDLNGFLTAQVREAGNAYLVDLTRCVLRVGFHRFFDWRYWHLGRAPFSREGLCEIAQEAFKYVRALTGKVRKCLVLDCDGVLWGGIVGEDGMEGITIGPSGSGAAHLEFQQEVLNLFHRGVILALCSRNNPSDVLHVLREHPDMLLREEHFASILVNWRDKASNIEAIAAELNIGLDSLVFVDDSEFEVEMVRSLLPEVEVLHLPAARASENRALLAACGLFDNLSLSEEDRRRGEMYRAEVKRQEHRAQATDLESYLTSLEMKVWIGPVDAQTADRVAQLTQRTNQFNLTTRRYSESEIRSFFASEDYHVLLVRVSDRFGDYGIVGTAILAHRGRQVEIDSFLLSCRVLGRQVEDVLLEACIRVARKLGASSILGRYARTKKNAQVRDFYAQGGFACLEASEEGGTFERPVGDSPVPRPHHFASVEIVEETRRAGDADQAGHVPGPGHTR